MGKTGQFLSLLSGSPNISTNLALTSSSSLSNCWRRLEMRSVTLSSVAAMWRCSSRGGRGISVSERVLLLTALNVLPVPLEFNSSILLDKAYHKYSRVQISLVTVKAAKPRPIQHSQFAIFKAPIGARTDIKISFSRAILMVQNTTCGLKGGFSPKSAFSLEKWKTITFFIIGR